MTLFVIRGRVQGVGFRAFTLKHATALGLKGWVRNCSDGSVETLIDGEALDDMKEYLRRGPHFARVDELTERPILPDDPPARTPFAQLEDALK